MALQAQGFRQGRASLPHMQEPPGAGGPTRGRAVGDPGHLGRPLPEHGHEQQGDRGGRYFQTYAFHYAFGPGGDHSQRSLILYNLTSGWIFNTLYETMKAHVPRSKRPQIRAVQYASPGFYRFSVDQAMADGIRESLTKYMVDRSTIDESVSDLRRWASPRSKKAEAAKKGRGGGRRRQKNSKREREGISTEDMAKRILLDTCSRLGVDGTSLLARTMETRRAVRILTSYGRRLAFLADRELKGQKMLVGLVGVAPTREGQTHPDL